MKVAMRSRGNLADHVLPPLVRVSGVDITRPSRTLRPSRPLENLLRPCLGERGGHNEVNGFLRASKVRAGKDAVEDATGGRRSAKSKSACEMERRRKVEERLASCLGAREDGGKGRSKPPSWTHMSSGSPRVQVLAPAPWYRDPRSRISQLRPVKRGEERSSPSQNNAEPASITAGTVSSGRGRLSIPQRWLRGITRVAPFFSVELVPATCDCKRGW
jgi:hypothetical protein